MTDLTEEEEQNQKDMLEQQEFERNMIIDFNKKTKEAVAASLWKNEVFRCEKEPSTKDTLVNDLEDFKEMKELIANGNYQGSGDSMMIDISSNKINEQQTSNYYDVKRLLIQEKGEEE